MIKLLLTVAGGQLMELELTMSDPVSLEFLTCPRTSTTPEWLMGMT